MELSNYKLTQDNVIEIKNLMDKIYGLKVKNIQILHGFVDLNLKLVVLDKSVPQPEESGNMKEYVLKIMNPEDTKRSDIVDAHHDVINIIAKSGFSTPEPIVNQFGELKYEVKFSMFNDEEKVMIRVFNYIHGKTLSEVSITYELIQQFGQYAGRLDSTLANFHHAALSNYETIWRLTQFNNLQEQVDQMKDSDKRNISQQIIQAFDREVLSGLSNFQKGTIHGDLNVNNVLVTPDNDNQLKISSILDFGDCSESYYIFEVGTAIAHLMMDCKDNMELTKISSQFLQGYRTFFQLVEEELSVLKLCICARLLQTAILCQDTHTHNLNNIHALKYVRWDLVEKVWHLPADKLV